MLYQMSYRPLSFIYFTNGRQGPVQLALNFHQEFDRPQLLLRKSNFKFEIIFPPSAEKWWALMGSNHRPQRYQHCALAS